jgi:hypothetical protein
MMSPARLGGRAVNGNSAQGECSNGNGPYAGRVRALKFS